MASEIKVDTVSEKTSGSGVTIDGLLIKDGGISGDVSLIGTTPTFTIGDAGAEDAALIFDGNAQDYYVGLDDSSDSLVLGLGSALGTTPAITINSSQVATLAQRPVFSSGITIADAGQIGSASDADAIAIASNGVVTFSQNPVFPDGGVAVADLDIDGATDIGAAIVDADLFIVDDGAGGTNRKVTASRIKTYAGGASTIKEMTDVLMDATNFTDGFLIQPNSDGSAPSTGTLSGANKNIGIGIDVYAALTEGDNNIAIGEGCGAAITTGYTNLIMGMDAGDNITTGYENVLLGGGAGGSLTTANNCIAIGRNALDVSQTDTNNIAIGMNALGSANYGGANQNVVIGNSAGDAVNTGDNNTYVGYNAGTTTESSSNNTLIGKDALSNLGNGGNNTAVGSTLAASSANMEHSITMGYDITGDSNDFKFGKSGNVVHNDFDADANWSRSSDVRKKRNIHSQELGLDFINDLRTVRFQWKPSYEFPKEWDDYDEENNMDTKIIMHGFIAQEVKEALDKHASDDDKKFSGWSEGLDGMQNTSREMFVIPLIKAVQELTAKVKKLEDK